MTRIFVNTPAGEQVRHERLVRFSWPSPVAIPRDFFAWLPPIELHGASALRLPPSCPAPFRDIVALSLALSGHGCPRYPGATLPSSPPVPLVLTRDGYRRVPRAPGA